ncbi:MAG: hypothetical protein OXI33_14095, partial [Chloroflexota bacterium]|nr:hypothetical protein [Chloroflexota bacterium]
FRLWTIFVERAPQPPERLPEFFILVEQAFARTVGSPDGDWPLPGARRVRARLDETPCISVSDTQWHLLGAQLANGIWGLYRGAARRAGLLDANMAWLSEDTGVATHATSRLRDAALDRLLELLDRGMHGETVSLPTDGRNPVPGALRRTFDEVPLRSHLRETLIEGHNLNQALANRLVRSGELHHRLFLARAAKELHGYRPVLDRMIDCENLLAVLESIFYRLCCAKGTPLDAVASFLPVQLGEIQQAREAFARSGTNAGTSTGTREDRLYQTIDTSSTADLARSVLSLHEAVCKERERALWVWEDQGTLHSDVQVAEPDDGDLRVGVPWRNDYYLRPLSSIAWQLKELGT